MKLRSMTLASNALMRARTALLLSGTLLLSACAGDASDSPDAAAGAGADVRSPEDAPVWPVGGDPAYELGVTEGDVEYQLHQVVGSTRLPDGGVAVMNAGSHELRIYDAAGSFVSATGRRGEGPGEFVRPTRLYRLADTIAVYDPGAARMSLHGLDGTFITSRRMQLSDTFAMDEWLHSRSWIDGPTLGVGRDPVIAALPALPPPDSAELFRYIRVSPFGHLWVRQPVRPGAATQWVVHGLDGAALGRVETPADFEIHEFGADYLLGRGRDALDIEYVRRYSLDTPGETMQEHDYATSPASGAGTADATSPVPADMLNGMRGALRTLASQQEIFYSQPANQYRYAMSVSEIPDYEAPEGFAVRIVNGNERGWSAVAVDLTTGHMCGLATGFVVPTGWMPGRVMCQ
ncbi:hypothetical protein BH23GEM10_BH23GEM10_06010 [soil metagenome]